MRRAVDGRDGDVHGTGRVVLRDTRRSRHCQEMRETGCSQNSAMKLGQNMQRLTSSSPFAYKMQLLWAETQLLGENGTVHTSHTLLPCFWKDIQRLAGPAGQPAVIHRLRALSGVFNEYTFEPAKCGTVYLHGTMANACLKLLFAHDIQKTARLCKKRAMVQYETHWGLMP